MKRLFFIINPVAGRGMYKQGLGEALFTLHSAGYEPTLRFTTRAGEAIELARLSAGYDLVCCLGGDGTLSEVTSGLMSLAPEERPPIGYFPLGTANDVATTLKLPKNDPAAVARRIAEGSPLAWDIGVFGEDRYFTYVAAFGAFTDVSYETPQQSKQALGHLAYLLEGMNRLPKLPHYRTRVELDSSVVEGDYIFGGVTNRAREIPRHAGRPERSGRPGRFKELQRRDDDDRQGLERPLHLCGPRPLHAGRRARRSPHGREDTKLPGRSQDHRLNTCPPRSLLLPRRVFLCIMVITFRKEA